MVSRIFLSKPHTQKCTEWPDLLILIIFSKDFIHSSVFENYILYGSKRSCDKLRDSHSNKNEIEHVDRLIDGHKN